MPTLNLQNNVTLNAPLVIMRVPVDAVDVDEIEGERPTRGRRGQCVQCDRACPRPRARAIGGPMKGAERDRGSAVARSGSRDVCACQTAIWAPDEPVARGAPIHRDVGLTVPVVRGRYRQV